MNYFYRKKRRLAELCDEQRAEVSLAYGDLERASSLYFYAAGAAARLMFYLPTISAAAPLLGWLGFFIGGRAKDTVSKRRGVLAKIVLIWTLLLKGRALWKTFAGLMIRFKGRKAK